MLTSDGAKILAGVWAIITFGYGIATGIGSDAASNAYDQQCLHTRIDSGGVHTDQEATQRCGRTLVDGLSIAVALFGGGLVGYTTVEELVKRNERDKLNRARSEDD